MSRTKNEPMRPNNTNKRLRGRNRSKNANPLARSYESNGPDVKICGSALQVADKYAQLARDAQSASDRVMAENYFQHAEHYYRIVASAYEQNGQPQGRDRQGDDRRDDGQDGNGRYDDRSFGNEQPVVNGHDAVDDDDGLRRALRTNGADRNEGERGNGSERRGRGRDRDRESESEREEVHAEGTGEQPHVDMTAAAEPAAEAAEVTAAPGEPQIDAEAAPAPEGEEVKPKRRRTPRPRTRTRRTEEGTPPEAPEPAS